MGYDVYTIEVSFRVRVSAHNSPDDARDQARVDELRQEVREFEAEVRREFEDIVD